MRQPIALGKQTTYVTEKHLDWLLSKYGIERASGASVEIDSTTLGAATSYKGSNGEQLKLLTDCSFLKLLGADRFSAIDVSDYEGADIICDLSKPVPESLYSKFDFIFDGSSLDNIFNPAEALVNISRMLRPGGRTIIVEHGTMFAGAYTAFSPGWFFDFFTANNYRDCKVYAGRFTDVHTLKFGPWPLSVYNWFGDKNGITPRLESGAELMLVVIAEKGNYSTDTALPVQYQYRDQEYQNEIFFPRLEPILNSERPIFHPEFAGRTLQQCPAFVRCSGLSVAAPF